MAEAEAPKVDELFNGWKVEPFLADGVYFDAVVLVVVARRPKSLATMTMRTTMMMVRLIIQPLVPQRGTASLLLSRF